MRYLILSASGTPLDEHTDLDTAEDSIHCTNHCILYVPEVDGELDEADTHNKVWMN
jgi:hypothetical protein